MDVFCALFYCLENTVFLQVILQKYDKLQTNKGVVFVDMLRGSTACLRLRSARSGRLCGCFFPGCGPVCGAIYALRMHSKRKAWILSGCQNGLVFLLVCWSVGLLVGWSVGQSVVCLFGWLFPKDARGEKSATLHPLCTQIWEKVQP